MPSKRARFAAAVYAVLADNGRVLLLRRAAESPDGNEYIDFIFEITEWRGAPIIGEPTKCSQLVWADPIRLPDDVVDYIAVVLNTLRAGDERLVLHGGATYRSCPVDHTGCQHSLGTVQTMIASWG